MHAAAGCCSTQLSSAALLPRVQIHSHPSPPGGFCVGAVNAWLHIELAGQAALGSQLRLRPFTVQLAAAACTLWLNLRCCAARRFLQHRATGHAEMRCARGQRGMWTPVLRQTVLPGRAGAVMAVAAPTHLSKVQECRHTWQGGHAGQAVDGMKLETRATCRPASRQRCTLPVDWSAVCR